MKTSEALITEFGTKMIPLEAVIHYTGLRSTHTLKERARNAALPFPVFRVGGSKRGKWFVNAEKLALYLDSRDREFTNTYIKTRE